MGPSPEHLQFGNMRNCNVTTTEQKAGKKNNMKSLTRPFRTLLSDQTSARVPEQNISADNAAVDQGAISKLRGRGRRPLTKPNEVHRKMIELSTSLAASEIARRFDVSRQRVHQVLRRWKHLCPVREKITKVTLRPAISRRERREIIVCFRLTAGQIARANDLLGTLGIRKHISHNAACRTVLLIAMDHFSVLHNSGSRSTSGCPKTLEDCQHPGQGTVVRKLAGNAA
jgi:hypothetical protein